MPRITINEVDKSWFVQEKDLSRLRVFTPILASSGPEEPVECDDINAFKETFGPKPTSEDKGNSWLMAASYLYAGMPVIAQRIFPESAKKASSISVDPSISTRLPVTIKVNNPLLLTSSIEIADTNLINPRWSPFTLSLEKNQDTQYVQPELVNSNSDFNNAIVTALGKQSTSGCPKSYLIIETPIDSETGLPYTAAQLNITSQWLTDISKTYNVELADATENSPSGICTFDNTADYDEVVAYFNSANTADHPITDVIRIEQVDPETRKIKFILGYPKGFSKEYGVDGCKDYFVKNTDIPVVVGNRDNIWEDRGVVTPDVIEPRAGVYNPNIFMSRYMSQATPLANTGIQDFIRNFCGISGAVTYSILGPNGTDYSVNYEVYIDSATNASFAVSNTDYRNSGDKVINYYYIEAKYKGDYGNDLTINTVHISDDNYRISVSRDGYVLETNIYNFTDRLSENYYEILNHTSTYINVVSVVDPSIDITTAYLSSHAPAQVKLAGGSNGSSITEDGVTLTIYDQVVKAIYEDDSLFDDVADPITYDIDIITNGGFSDLTENSYNTMGKVDAVFKNLATVRGDSIYLVDGHSEWDYKQFFKYCGLFTESRTAGIGPWGYGSLLYNGIVTLIPGSYSLLISWGMSVSNGNPKWMSPAGLNRSYLNSFFKYPKYKVNRVMLNLWQSQDYLTDSKAYKVNPIMQIKNAWCIYGNSTLLHDGANGQTSMLQSFNVRVIVNLIRMYALEISTKLQFDQLNDTLFDEFKTLMDTKLDLLKHQGALYDYKVSTKNGETLTLADRNSKTLPIKIAISPIGACENIDITLEINQSGISFSDDDKPASDIEVLM